MNFNRRFIILNENVFVKDYPIIKLVKLLWYNPCFLKDTTFSLSFKNLKIISNFYLLDMVGKFFPA